ncbi:HDOD domain-containing protein [Imhoffiella purpurea]|uniref:HDOD domain-containing protein n=1 Tax=Imhoffiella purpurea TaxID=1249627 RepID=W9V584_9GAMM|nr:HDOD domain-containing protein [Imhoffiella purpurea]EXJ14484.1 hypothetical protein D779_2625 [Imhoffiella purpurea]
MSETTRDDSIVSDSNRYPPKADLELAFQTIRKARIPQMPDVVFGLRDELGKPDPDFRVAADLISHDVALTGQVLKAVNSPLFRCRTKITNVQQAVTMMGVSRLTNLVTAEAIQRMLGVAQGPALVVWDSMMKHAQAMLAIAESAPGMALDEVYLFGIMQDVGALIFADMIPEYGSVWVLRSEADPKGLMEFERKRVGVDHVTVGFLVAGNWRLPEHIALAIYRHRDPDCSDLLGTDVGVFVSLSRLAQYLVAVSHGSHELFGTLSQLDSDLAHLSIEEDEWAALCERATNGEWAAPA